MYPSAYYTYNPSRLRRAERAYFGGGGGGGGGHKHQGRPLSDSLLQLDVRATASNRALKVPFFA